MAVFKCEKCLPANIPDDWTNERKSEAATLIRKAGGIAAILHFRPIGMELRDVKNIVLHVTEEKGKCHHCKIELVAYEGNCLKCGRLNLDW